MLISHKKSWALRVTALCTALAAPHAFADQTTAPEQPAWSRPKARQT
jgi:nitrite reductase (NO-forming)/hydroxylamine reductase